MNIHNGDGPLRCHACQQPLGADYLETPNGMVWCTDTIGCNFRSRRRLGVPLHVAYEAKARELEQQAGQLQVAAGVARHVGERLKAEPPRIRDDDYLTHIRSDRWRVFADEQRLMALFRCERCGSQVFDLDVHHRDYARLGQERPEDVLVLCRICHGDLDDARRAGAHPRFTVTVTGRARPLRLVQWHDDADEQPAGRSTP